MTSSRSDWLVAEWPAPRAVRSLLTTRSGGVSRPPFASLNLGDHVGDDALAVSINRQRLAAHLPAAPRWLQQVHGTSVVEVHGGEEESATPRADAALTRVPGVVCGVLTADCLPLLLCDRPGSVVAAVHAGWRGLLAGVVQTTVRAMAVDGRDLLAYLGPAIGPQAFVVGDEVRSAFVDSAGRSAAAFRPLAADCRTAASAGEASGRTESQFWLADLYLLARQALAEVGVETSFGGEHCTVSDARRFFSYRRDGATGRMASLIWLATD